MQFLMTGFLVAGIIQTVRFINQEMLKMSVIEFKWERVSSDTLRAKVIGGWVVTSEGYSTETGDVISSSMVFVPDPDHEWKFSFWKKPD